MVSHGGEAKKPNKIENAAGRGQSHSAQPPQAYIILIGSMGFGGVAQSVPRREPDPILEIYQAFAVLFTPHTHRPVELDACPCRSPTPPFPKTLSSDRQ